MGAVQLRGTAVSTDRRDVVDKRGVRGSHVDERQLGYGNWA